MLDCLLRFMKKSKDEIAFFFHLSNKQIQKILFHLAFKSHLDLFGRRQQQ